MGVFDDKKFESLDWISQATEPIDSKMNEILAKMPDSYDITFEIFQSLNHRSYSMDLSVQSIIGHILKLDDITFTLTHNQITALNKCFKFESDDNVRLNYEDKTLTGNLRLIKVSSTMDEDVLKGMLGADGIEQVGYCSLPQPISETMSRMNEVMEILSGCNDGLRTRSHYKKRNVITKRLQALFKGNEWNIRDTELANKVGYWIRDYIQDGNLAAFSNFCRLKVMTHKGQPIYSMEEIE